MDAATGKERLPTFFLIFFALFIFKTTLTDDTTEAGVMRMSADDDDQADQLRKLAVPGTAET